MRAKWSMLFGPEGSIILWPKGSILFGQRGQICLAFPYKGWNPDIVDGSGTGSWNHYLAYYKRSQNQFVIDENFSHQGSDDISVGCGFSFGTYAVGDFNGDGYFDMIEAGYVDHTTVWLNNGEEELSEAPVAPTDLATTVQDGVLNITWEDDNNEEYLTYYNVHILDTNGKLVSFTTSALENGKLTSYPEFSTLLHTRSYSIALPVGEYTIKVQAINHAYQASEFTVLKTNTSIDGLAAEKDNVVVKAVENGIWAIATEEMNVNVYTVSGQFVASGVTNQVIPVSANGIYLVQVAGKTHKVVKI